MDDHKKYLGHATEQTFKKSHAYITKYEEMSLNRKKNITI